MPESVGQRIARYRGQNDWTQEQLAERIAISRVAISHIEMGLSIPSERTITLMASVFKSTPHELVHGTTYPLAKAERLPLSVAWFTHREQDIGLLERDLIWLQRLAEDQSVPRCTTDVVEDWLPKVNRWLNTCYDDEERQRLRHLRAKLIALG